MQTNSLPPGITFIERDWLSANHVLFHDGAQATLIDTGYVSFADVTLSKVASALNGAMLTRIINTHIHSDHIGCNSALQRAHPGVKISVPTEEVAALENWDCPEQMLSYADQEAEPFAWNDQIDVGQTLSLGGEACGAWETIATPGHDMGSLVLYSPKLRILISADALWHNSFGFVVPQAIDPLSVAAQRATFKRLAELDVALVIPGHGPMFTDFSASLKDASDKLEAFAQDDMRIAKNVVKGMFIYSMMWRETMALSELPHYVKRIGVHRDYNAQFFQMSDEAYADWLIGETERAGKIRIVDNVIESVA
jgi:glyoxylase-like metal-dependent hydrolase (beta-lactamase superfamily II)